MKGSSEQLTQLGSMPDSMSKYCTHIKVIETHVYPCVSSGELLRRRRGTQLPVGQFLVKTGQNVFISW